MEVYEPAEDSYLIRKHIKDYAEGRVLDMGTGSGVLAEEARKYADEVIAADLNHKAIEYGRKHIEGVTFIESDLFENIDGKFNLIIFNPPYLPKDKAIDDIALYGGDKGHEVIGRFLAQASDYLEDEGAILLLFSQLTKKHVVDKLIHDNCLQKVEIDNRQVFFENLYVYAIRKTDLRKKLEKRGIKDISYLSHGRRGVIYTGMLDDMKVTIKAKKPDSEAMGRIENEAFWLPRMNEQGIGPPFIDKGEDYIIYSYVEGRDMDQFLESADKDRILDIFTDILTQCRKMDRLKVDKEEMTRPLKNLLIDKHVTLIDFERMHPTLHPKNVTQFCQFLSSGGVSHHLERVGLHFDKVQLIELAKAYKEDPNDENYGAILRILGRP
jgi:release factor glutamine methyltransferase